MISDGFARVARGWVRKDAQKSCFGRPQVDQNDGEGAYQGVVDVPKGTVVVGDRRRAPEAEQGCDSGGLARRTVSPGNGSEK